MPGLAHIVDDDASFKTAIERHIEASRLRGQLASRKRPELHAIRRADTRLGWSRAAEATERTRLNAAIIFLKGNPVIRPPCGLSRPVRMTS